MGKSDKKVKSERVNALRKQYDSFLEEDKKRKERNEYILGRLDEMRSCTALVPRGRRVPHIKFDTFDSKVNYIHANSKPRESFEKQIQRPNNLLVPCAPSALLNEELVLKEVSKKYILIPKLTPTTTPSPVEQGPSAVDNTHEDTDWKNKYEILSQLKRHEKEMSDINDTDNFPSKTHDLDKRVIFTDNLINDTDNFPSKTHDLDKRVIFTDNLTNDVVNTNREALLDDVPERDYDAIHSFNNEGVSGVAYNASPQYSSSIEKYDLEHSEQNSVETNELINATTEDNHYYKQPTTINKINYDITSPKDTAIDIKMQNFQIQEGNQNEQYELNKHEDRSLGSVTHNILPPQQEKYYPEQTENQEISEQIYYENQQTDNVNVEKTPLEATYNEPIKVPETQVTNKNDDFPGNPLKTEVNSHTANAVQGEINVDPANQIIPEQNKYQENQYNPASTIEAENINKSDHTEEIEEFNQENANMIHSENGAQNYEEYDQQGHGDVYNAEHSTEQTYYDQNAPYEYYDENTQNQAYPQERMEGVTEQQYDQSPEQQYNPNNQVLDPNHMVPTSELEAQSQQGYYEQKYNQTNQELNGMVPTEENVQPEQGYTYDQQYNPTTQELDASGVVPAQNQPEQSYAYDDQQYNPATAELDVNGVSPAQNQPEQGYAYDQQYNPATAELDVNGVSPAQNQPEQGYAYDQQYNPATAELDVNGVSPAQNQPEQGYAYEQQQYTTNQDYDVTATAAYNEQVGLPEQDYAYDQQYGYNTQEIDSSGMVSAYDVESEQKLQAPQHYDEQHYEEQTTPSEQVQQIVHEGDTQE